MKGKGFFVTGTDTDIGKTVASLGLIASLQQKGLSVAGMKPVACGGIETSEGLRNEDALALQQASNVSLSYDDVNPLLFAPPIAPHIAAEELGQVIDIPKLAASYEKLSGKADQIVVEGVGGWQVPLNDTQTVADLAYTLGLPVVLVVGMRLGCLNHALLTAADILGRGLPLAGWIANCINPDFSYRDNNLAALQARIQAPLIGDIPYYGSSIPDPTTLSGHFTLV